MRRCKDRRAGRFADAFAREAVAYFHAHVPVDRAELKRRRSDRVRRLTAGAPRKCSPCPDVAETKLVCEFVERVHERIGRWLVCADVSGPDDSNPYTFGYALGAMARLRCAQRRTSPRESSAGCTGVIAVASSRSYCARSVTTRQR